MKKEESIVGEATITTSYGKIFYLFVGEKKDPLYLIIHGSGSESGSHHYLTVLHEFAIRFLPIWHLFVVAIDCPGYGKSEGNKQTIRSYPAKFLQEFIVNLTGKKAAFCLSGHSQGGCSIFNAVLEDPSLTRILVQDRPVCGDIKRLKAIKQPTLLIYDVEDDGHPVKQGKLIAKEIPHNEFITFIGSKEPYWHSDHLFDTILSFVKKFKGLIGEKSLPPSILSETAVHHEPKKENPVTKPKAKVVKTEEKKIHEPTKTEVKKEEKEETKTEVKKEIKEEIKVIEAVPKETIKKEGSEPNEDTKEISKVEIKVEPKEVKVSDSKEILADEIDINCPICLELLWKPIKLPCGHFACAECLKCSIIYNPCCPMCRSPLEMDQKAVSASSAIDTTIQDYIAKKVGPEVLKQRKKKAMAASKTNAQAIKIEYGNYSKSSGYASGGKEKFSWTLFVKVLSSSVPNPISHVEFDINPQMKGSKPIKVTKTPYELERSGNYEFGCEISVHWKPTLGFKPYVVPHTVTLGPPKTSRQFLQPIVKNE